MEREQHSIAIVAITSSTTSSDVLLASLRISAKILSSALQHTGIHWLQHADTVHTRISPHHKHCCLRLETSWPTRPVDSSVPAEHCMEPAETSNGTQEPVHMLFDLIDRDNDGHLDLKEVAALFKRLAPDRSTQSAYNAAVEALLLTDSNIDRKLDRSEFQELLNRLAGVAGIPSTTAAQRLFTAATNNHDDNAAGTHDRAPTTVESGAAASQDDQGDQQVPARPLAATTAVSAPVADPAAPFDAALNRDGQQDHQEANVDAKLQRLFGLWDRSGDGSISFDELCQGLAKLMQLKGKQDITSLLSEAARILSRHDTNGDRRLQYDEFTMFLVKFMWAAGFMLVDVLDELTMLAQKRDSKKIRVVVDSAQPQIDSLLSEAGR